MKIKTQKKKKMKVAKGHHSLYEILPFKRRVRNVAVTRNNQYISYLKVTPRNLGNLSGVEQEQMMRQFENLERTYNEDHGILSLMFPPRIVENVQFWNKMLQEARQEQDMARIETCKKQLNKLAMIRRSRPNQEFYIVVYADSLGEMQKRKEQLIRLGGQALGLKELSEDEFEAIQAKELNMSTEI